jgi:hypothetical protein
MRSSRCPFRPCLLVLLSLAFVVAACGDSDDGDPSHDDAVVSEQGLFEAHVSIAPHPPVTGANEMQVHLMDASGEAVTEAKVEVEPWMPGHGHGSPETPVVAEDGDGMYTVTDVVFSMPGHWEVRVDVTDGGDEDRLIVEYDVQ